MNNKKITPITHPKQDKKFYLYGLYCPYSNDLKYVGITTGELSTRLSGHLRKPTNGKIALWFKELKKYNEKPLIKLIKEFTTYSDLLNGEICEIKRAREIKLGILNIADGGDINPMFGHTHTEESKKKISETHKGSKRTEKQIKEKKELLNKLWSNEEWSNKIRQKMSENMIGNKHLLGHKHSEESKQKMSKKHKGRKYNVGYKHTDETKKLMSYNNSGENNPMFGRVLPQETIKKRSEKVIKEGTFNGKNNPNFKYDITYDDLYYYYITKNLKIDEIAKIYGCHRTVISNNIKKYKIIKPLSNKYNLNLPDIEKHIKDGKNLVEIGLVYGCSNKTINNFIKNNKHGK